MFSEDQKCSESKTSTPNSPADARSPTQILPTQTTVAGHIPWRSGFDTVRLASGQRVATVLGSLSETTGRLVWRASD
jgi:hypothetical protein